MWLLSLYNRSIKIFLTDISVGIRAWFIFSSPGALSFLKVVAEDAAKIYRAGTELVGYLSATCPFSILLELLDISGWAALLDYIVPMYCLSG